MPIKIYIPKYIHGFVLLTRMTTFRKTKLNITDDQTNIDMYKLAANITEYHILSKFCGPVSHLR